MSGDPDPSSASRPADPRRRLLRTATEPRRFFLVPEGAEIGPGELVVRALDGRSDRLDEAALAPHEVDAARAAAHVDAGVERLFAPVRSGLRDLFGGSAESEPSSDVGAVGGGFARWLGVTPGEVMVDRVKRRQGRRTLLEKAGRLFRPELADADIDALEARLDHLGEVVTAEGQRLAGATEELAGQVSAAFTRAEDGRSPVEDAVQEAGDQAVQLGQSAIDELDRIGRQIRGGPVADPPPPPGPEPQPDEAVEEAQELPPREGA